MRAKYDELSPYIEAHTAALCPNCQNVCCMDRHGEYEAEDLVYLETLGEPLPDIRPKALDTDPCRHMTSTGCALPRWQRPFRCTWFFCAALLGEMPRKDKKKYRMFIETLRELQAIWTSAAISIGRVEQPPE